MLGLGADQVIARDGVVLNPHYGTMGLYGSEYWTYVLPRRVGAATAAALTDSAYRSVPPRRCGSGLVDEVIAGPPVRLRPGRVGLRRWLARSDYGRRSNASVHHGPSTNDASRSRRTASRSWRR